MRATRTALVGLLAAPTLAASLPAHAATQSGSEPGIKALYHNRLIDLSRGWQGARACVELTAGDVRCYDTRAQMHAARDDAVAALGSDRLVGDATALADCGGSAKFLRLFSGTNYSGTELDFIQTVGWSNLNGYGFDNTMESWINEKTCDTLVADGTGGTSPRLTLTANGKSSNCGSWNNRASSAFVSY